MRGPRAFSASRWRISFERLRTLLRSGSGNLRRLAHIDEPNQVPSRSSDAEHLVSKEPLDREHRLDILRPVAPLSAVRPIRIQEQVEFSLPIPERMDLDARDVGRHADADRLIRLI